MSRLLPPALSLVVLLLAACPEPESTPDAGVSAPTSDAAVDAGVDAGSVLDAEVDAARGSFEVHVRVEGDGEGHVRSADGRIHCPGTCSATYPEGDEVTFTSRLAVGTRLRRWTGYDSTATTDTFSITVDREQWVNAELVPIVLDRAVMTDGEGYRAIRSSVADPTDGTLVIAGVLGPDSTICGAEASASSGAFVAKVDPSSAACRWVKTFASSRFAAPYGLVVSGGQVVLGGYFELDLTIGDRTLTAEYGGGFLVSLAGDDGALAWTAPAAGQSIPGINDLAVTGAGTIVSCGGAPQPIRGWSAAGAPVWASDTELPYCARLALGPQGAYAIGTEYSGGGAYSVAVAVVGIEDGIEKQHDYLPVEPPYIDIYRLVVHRGRVYALVSEIASEDTYLLRWDPATRAYAGVLVGGSTLDVEADLVVDAGRLLTVTARHYQVAFDWWTPELVAARSPASFETRFVSGLRAIAAPGQPLRVALSTSASSAQSPEDFNGLWLTPEGTTPVLLDVASRPTSPVPRLPN